jgi:hypothetical protein
VPLDDPRVKCPRARCDRGTDDLSHKPRIKAGRARDTGKAGDSVRQSEVPEIGALVPRAGWLSDRSATPF